MGYFQTLHEWQPCPVTICYGRVTTQNLEKNDNLKSGLTCARAALSVAEDGGGHT